MSPSYRPNSMRLWNANYRFPNAYFVTMCTHQRQCTLSKILGDKVELSDLGQLANETLLSLPNWYTNVKLDHFVIMPNHIHAIIQLTDVGSPLGRVVGAFKSATSRLAHCSLLPSNKPLWQRGFWDHIVRSERELFVYRQYIADNPVQWHLDGLNFLNPEADGFCGLPERYLQK